MHSRGVLSLLAVSMFVVTVAVPGGIVTAVDDDPGDITQAGIDAERIVIEVNLQTDGSALWTVEHRVRLDDPNATEGFEDVQQQLERNRSELVDPFEQSVRAMATTAQERTGREMVIENVSVEATREQIPQEYGIVSFQFQWYGFAETGENLRTSGALSFLDSSNVLLVTWPEETTVAEVTPEPDERRDRSVVWKGPIEFSQGEPSIVLESESESFGPNLAWNVQSNDRLIVLATGGLLFATVGFGIAGVVRRLRGSGSDEEDELESPDNSGTESESADESSTADEEKSPEELLSNEERVLKLLDDRGGRVKQQAIVEAFDWSETKTSEVVGELREADEIDVYRLGRENVLTLPDVGVGIGSDDESGGEDG